MSATYKRTSVQSSQEGPLHDPHEGKRKRLYHGRIIAVEKKGISQTNTL